ncbi:hypothetical protein [Paracoccus marcusii]|uniref:hypothetical protein n=1 Tax=Paracoccus marcusii TaxID=59779 RepID=UPI002ED27B2B
MTLYTYYNLLGKGRVGVEWLLQKTGLGASNQFESCGFIRSSNAKDYPDIQYHFLPLAVRYDGNRRPRVTGSRPSGADAVEIARHDPAGIG